MLLLLCLALRLGAVLVLEEDLCAGAEPVLVTGVQTAVPDPGDLRVVNVAGTSRVRLPRPASIRVQRGAGNWLALRVRLEAGWCLALVENSTEAPSWQVRTYPRGQLVRSVEPAPASHSISTPWKATRSL